MDLNELGRKEFIIEESGPFIVNVIDSVNDYIQLMEEIFDFNQVLFWLIFVSFFLLSYYKLLISAGKFSYYSCLND